MPELFERHTVSFVLRLWQEPSQQASARHWRGQIEHIGSGETAYFQVPEAMFAALQLVLGNGPSTPTSEDIAPPVPTP